MYGQRYGRGNWASWVRIRPRSDKSIFYAALRRLLSPVIGVPIAVATPWKKKRTPRAPADFFVPPNPWREPLLIPHNPRKRSRRRKRRPCVFRRPRCKMGRPSPLDQRQPMSYSKELIDWPENILDSRVRWSLSLFILSYPRSIGEISDDQTTETVGYSDGHDHPMPMLFDDFCISR